MQTATSCPQQPTPSHSLQQGHVQEGVKEAVGMATNTGSDRSVSWQTWDDNVEEFCEAILDVPHSAALLGHIDGQHSLAVHLPPLLLGHRYRPQVPSQ